MRKIENLVFEGGGVLGMAYAGAIEVLEENNILAGVKRVAGTSVGSIAALLVSLNYTPSEITEVMSSTNFKDFEDHKDPFRIPLHYGLYKGDFLLKWIKGLVERKTGNAAMTYADFHHAGYRELKVFACNLCESDIREFSYNESPDVNVAESIRASMSIPLFFSAWQFPNAIPDDHIYVDGGTIYNYPIDTFDSLDNTLGFFFEHKGSYQELKKDHIVKYIEVLFRTILKAQKVDFHKNQQEVNVTVFIDPHDISATDFSLTEDQKTLLYTSGKEATKKYLSKD